MKHIPIFLTALLLAPLLSLHAADAPKPKPNIVFILVDDMPYAGPSVTGNKLLQTPHMDRIAKEGMLFSRAYTEPVCGPSRATLMTGQFAGRHGRTDNVPACILTRSCGSRSRLCRTECLPRASLAKRRQAHGCPIQCSPAVIRSCRR